MTTSVLLSTAPDTFYGVQFTVELMDKHCPVALD